MPEVIELARGRVHVNIELKIYGNDRRIAAAVADFVRREHFENQCLVASLDVEAVRQAKRHNPNLTTAAIVTVAVGNIAKLDVDVLSLNKKLVTVELLRQARDFGKGVLVWTVNDSREMQSLIEIGAGRLITNDPPALVRLRKERADLGPSGRILQAMRYWLGVKPKLPEDEGELRP